MFGTQQKLNDIKKKNHCINICIALLYKYFTSYYQGYLETPHKIKIYKQS